MEELEEKDFEEMFKTIKVIKGEGEILDKFYNEEISIEKCFEMIKALDKER